MAVGDTYQVVDTMTLDGQKCLNVYFYDASVGVDGDATATDVAQAFIDTLLPSIVAVQSSDITHISVKATNLFDDSDQHEELLSEPGTLDDPVDTVFTAYGFRLVGDNASIRSGAKRIAGVGDSGVDQNVVIDGGLLTGLSTLATDLAATLPFGVGDVGQLFPVIVKRILDAGQYRLPTNAGEALLSFITEGLFDTFVTSQVSRKIGRGE